MERRHGSRFTVNQAAALSVDHEVVGIARVLNASLTGAFIDASAILPAGTHVSLWLAHPLSESAQRMDACVVRTYEHGLGLHWDPGAVPVVVELLAARLRHAGFPVQSIAPRKDHSTERPRDA